MAKLNIVLYEPEIPSNTGNIGRTCVATGTRLHLIEPLGFRLNEKAIKRAGMDYWKDLDVTTYLNYQDFLEKNPGAKIYMATTKAPQVYTEVHYEEDCYIMFGKESAGIPEEILLENQETAIRDPYDRRYPVSESEQFCCHRPLRAPAAESLRSHAARRTSDKISVEINNGGCRINRNREYD